MRECESGTEWEEIEGDGRESLGKLREAHVGAGRGHCVRMMKERGRE